MSKFKIGDRVEHKLCNTGVGEIVKVQEREGFDVCLVKWSSETTKEASYNLELFEENPDEVKVEVSLSQLRDVVMDALGGAFGAIEVGLFGPGHEEKQDD